MTTGALGAVTHGTVGIVVLGLAMTAVVVGILGIPAICETVACTGMGLGICMLGCVTGVVATIGIVGGS
jgi:hypothetical protein